MKLLQFHGKVGHPEHGFGFRPDPEPVRYAGFNLHPASGLLVPRAGLVSSASPLRSFSSIDEYAPPILNQGRTGSCMGFGTAGALTTTYTSKGLQLPGIVDPLVAYQLARSISRSSPSVPLQDVGTYPSAMFKALAQWGAPLDTELEEDRRVSDPEYTAWCEEHVNDELKLLELQVANTRPIVKVNAIYETGADLRDAVCAALDDGYAVMAAVDAGNAKFQEFSGGVLDYTGDVPDHWVYFTAQRLVSGERQILMRNSWSRDWGEDGKAWCSEKFVTRGLFYPMVANLGL